MRRGWDRLSHGLALYAFATVSQRERVAPRATPVLRLENPHGLGLLWKYLLWKLSLTEQVCS